VQSILEQVVESFTRILGGRCAASRSLLFYSHTDLEELALVTEILLDHPLRHLLHAFESPGRVEVSALLTGVQFETAFRALSKRFGKPRQQCSTLCATGDRVSARHMYRTWAEGIFARGPLLRRRLLALTTRVLITMLPVFTIRQRNASLDTEFRTTHSLSWSHFIQV